MKRVAMYLRKSRADVEAENRGEEETLAKHKRALFKLAKDQNLNIIKVRQEVVSGESLLHRPEMMELLKEVENKFYDAVLVMDMDRLGRGNMREQGLILETFQNSGTKIITPRKTYDLQDEFDEEYSEFEAFMARKELKIISRRMQSGIKRAVMEGNYLGTHPPYGYQIVKDKKHRTLVPDPEQSLVVKMIFDWYTSDIPENRLGTRKIAHKLNNLGYRSYTGKSWNPTCVLVILKNAVYTGRIQWKKQIRKKTGNPEKKYAFSLQPKDKWIDVEGLHESIISKDLYEKAQEILKKRSHVPYSNKNITNPLAGLIRCKKCNYSMVKRLQKSRDRICCREISCKCRSSIFEIVEQRLLDSLQQWLDKYTLRFSEHDFIKKDDDSKGKLLKTSINNLQQEIKRLEEQKGTLHDFLERGVYDENTYLERSTHIANRIADTQVLLTMAIRELETENKRLEAKVQIIPSVEHVLHQYPLLDDPKKKNMLLKSVIDYCTYEKELHQKLDDFTLIVYPKL
ncbi:DNA invertase Pin-like site-specific DNA recombinase [Croceifilum oryzae]|uniref:DNA invertase Pin-like site-specific DNA recombinase n=1 Tax=Croceifilum oryzae TaxID=1553429 RepID=A0AAJ1THE2_9BACL|nr:recombinase family protein [Croceifilum oryzae]MDQ0418499.1 DNA invertase Pin-like site-specific DNA recombinase [Croceifilum oryzae]